MEASAARQQKIKQQRDEITRNYPALWSRLIEAWRQPGMEHLEKLRRTFKECRLLVTDDHVQISDSEMVTSWRTSGSPANQDKFVSIMLGDRNILKLDY